MKKNLAYLLLIAILLISFPIFNLNKDNNINEELKIEIAPTSEKTVELVTLYFADKGRQYLVRENRVIEHIIEMPEKIILEELIKGPVNPRNFGVVPSNTKIHSIEIRNDTAYINLSEEFRKDMEFGSNNEVLAIYSIVNTLTQFKTIKNVKLSVEGKEDALQKYMPLDHIYKQDLNIVNNPIKNPIEVVREYFDLLDRDEYRQAYDLLYDPSNVNIDYSMYYHYQKSKNISKHSIYTYKMIEEDSFKIVTFDYSEESEAGDVSYYNDVDFKLKNYLGEWKIVIEYMPNELIKHE